MTAANVLTPYYYKVLSPLHSLIFSPENRKKNQPQIKTRMLTPVSLSVWNCEPFKHTAERNGYALQCPVVPLCHVLIELNDKGCIWTEVFPLQLECMNKKQKPYAGQVCTASIGLLTAVWLRCRLNHTLHHGLHYYSESGIPKRAISPQREICGVCTKWHYWEPVISKRGREREREKDVCVCAV